MAVCSYPIKSGVRYWLVCMAGIMAFMLVGTSARAFLPDAGGNRITLSGRSITPNRLKVSHEGGSGEGLRRLREESGQEWVGLWNVWGTIHRLYVKHPSQAIRLRGGTVTDEEIWSCARQLIRTHSDCFKVPTGDLVEEDIIRRGGIIYCRLRQYYQGIPVYGGGIQFRFDEAGNLLMICGDTYPGIAVSPHPAISTHEAELIVRRTAGMEAHEEGIDEIGLFVLPVPMDAGVEYLLAWQVPVLGGPSLESRLFFINAHTGDIILTYDLDRRVVQGTVRGLVLPKYFNDPPEWVPFSNQDVHLLNFDQPVYENNLDADPGWTREGMWEFGDPEPQDINIYGHAGCPDPNSGFTGQNVFGYNLTGDYTNLMRPKYLTTHTISCTNKTGVTLLFQRWLGVQREYWEDDDGTRTSYDRATVEVSNDAGLTWTVIWSNGTSQIEDGVYDGFLHVWKGWNLEFFDISDQADGESVTIRWGMGPTDGSGTFCGWNVDDIGVYESLKEETDPNGYFQFPDTGGVPDNTLVSHLSGEHVEVLNEDGSAAIYLIRGIGADPNTPFAVDWDTNHTTINAFDEFNAFYHVNRLLSTIKGLDPLYTVMDDKGPITVVVRYGDNYKNAFWSPEHKICFGEGDSSTNGYRNFTHFSDIIYHEYAHAVTDSFYALFMPPLTSIRRTTSGDQTGPVFVTEFDAMHEAFSDYWACTINGDPLIGDGDFWIGHAYVRNLDNTFKYPDDYGDDAYANSLILSGAMWETRQLLGKEVADPLFHLARYGGATTFDDFLVDVLLQDEISNGGEHVPLIKDIFGLRGISRAPGAPNGLVAVAGDTYVDLNWRASPDSDEVSGYYVYFRTENDIASDREDPSVRRDAGPNTTYQLEGLTNGTTYVLKVSSYNVYLAESDPSELAYATPYTVPSNASVGSERRIFCFIESVVH